MGGSVYYSYNCIIYRNSLSWEVNLSTRRILRNSQGQLAIFVALVFQVLFVLFAMAINVALIVHDKINLQNSVDLAAYYAAAKQAEMLNAIAHQNYQIRQAYKLMAWRYRVQGSAGILQDKEVKAPQFKHPSHFPPNSAGNLVSESEWFGASVSQRQWWPAMCIKYTPAWKDAPPDENVCKDRNLNVPTIPVIPIVAGFNPINVVINSISSNLQHQFDKSCQNVGVWNWWFMKATKESFRQDMGNRRAVIEAMARAASRPAETWVDIDGNSIFAGARTTFYKNLTWSNSTTSPEEIQFEVHNSLDRYEADISWLQPIKITPHFMYIDVPFPKGCKTQVKNYEQPPQNSSNTDFAFIMGNLGGATFITDRPGTPFPDTSILRLVAGYEKNPWIMSYVSVRAQVKSRQIFHPFGEPVTLTATAYAKPFGGRIGPWYGREWSPGNPQSSGFKVDVRGQPRTEAGGLMDAQTDPDRLPNYSRFPGDKLGLASRIAQSALRALNAANQFATYDYYDIYKEIKAGDVNDPLAWDYNANKHPIPRNYEISAIIPDLFDITYYSIDANYWGNYGSRIQANRTQLGIPDNVVIRPDLGFREGVPDLRTYSVRDQINFAKSTGLQIQKAFYFTKDHQHLLTSWLPGPLVNNYSESTDPNIPFGKCIQPDYSSDPNNPAPPNPGACIVGGRVGYSVKLVSGRYLKSDNFLIGSGNTKGPILNKPPF